MLMEFVIRHNGKDWLVENEHLTVSAPTLDDLDKELEKRMKQKGLIKKGERSKVFMAFDNSTIPQWIRQYAQHYFNRIVEIQG
jgi:hypothetical protein